MRSGIRNNYSNVAVRKITGSHAFAVAGKTKSTRDYLKKLQKQVPYLKLGEGSGFSAVRGVRVNTLNISPGLLAQMQRDPKKERECIQQLKDIQFALRMVDSCIKTSGKRVVYRYCYLDGNGKYHACSQTKKEDGKRRTGIGANVDLRL